MTLPTTGQRAEERRHAWEKKATVAEAGFASTPVHMVRASRTNSATSTRVRLQGNSRGISVTETTHQPTVRATWAVYVIVVRLPAAYGRSGRLVR